jgi:prefoldin beta subunit
MDPRIAQRMNAELQAEVKIIQEMNTKLNSLLTQRAKIHTQLNENEMVAKELDLLPEDELDESASGVVYKLIGPVLVRQNLGDAKRNVQNRLKFFQAEMYVDRIDSSNAFYCMICYV